MWPSHTMNTAKLQHGRIIDTMYESHWMHIYGSIYTKQKRRSKLNHDSRSPGSGYLSWGYLSGTSLKKERQWTHRFLTMVKSSMLWKFKLNAYDVTFYALPYFKVKMWLSMVSMPAIPTFGNGGRVTAYWRLYGYKTRPCLLKKNRKDIKSPMLSFFKHSHL